MRSVSCLFLKIAGYPKLLLLIFSDMISAVKI